MGRYAYFISESDILMISESAIIFGETGNIVMVLDGALPKDEAIMFRIHKNDLEILSNNKVVYTEQDLDTNLCHRIKQHNEIGLMEVIDQQNPPNCITNVAFQRA